MLFTTPDKKDMIFDAAMHAGIEHQDSLVEALHHTLPTDKEDWKPITLVVYFDPEKGGFGYVEAPPPCWSNLQEKEDWVADMKEGCRNYRALFCLIVTGAYVAEEEGADMIFNSPTPMTVSDLPAHLRKDMIIVHMNCARGDRIVMFENSADSEIKDTGVCNEGNGITGDMVGFIEPAPTSSDTPTN